MMGRSKKKHRGNEADVDALDDDETTAEGANATEDVEDELTQAIREREQFREQWERARADYQNLQNRLPKQVDDRVRAVLEPLLRDLLQVDDYLEMALASPTTSDDARNLAFGVEMVKKLLLDALGSFGVEGIDVAAGSLFDPSQHEAVATTEDSDAEPGTIVDVNKRGFAWRERVLRHAQVTVVPGGVVAAGAPGVEPSDVTLEHEAGSGATDTADDTTTESTDRDPSADA
ncbi:heat shock protein GrpE [Planctomycetes bacterium Pla163]|uniref:Protein GrpE n=1 Tax=Rohdeia mirabilis TaxID=2528008 RepID=A0A518CZT0_9BACT|nr:heat shock protein GrpE [Planctomycetes bacterium Pla163]